MGIMDGRVIVSVLSLLLLMGVVAEAGEKTLQAVNAFCDMTPYKEICMEKIGPVAKNDSSSTKDYLMAMIEAAAAEVRAGMEVTNTTQVKPEEEIYHMAKDDCSELLDYAVEELHDALSTVGDNDLKSLGDRVDDLLNWLTAVYSYQSSCIDEFEDSEYKPAIQNGLLNATQLTNNAIDIIAKISSLVNGLDMGGILKDLGSKIGISSSEPSDGKVSGGRRLLDNDDGSGFPSWMEARDRKLIGGPGPNPVPDAVVAKDGSGKFRTITDALKAYAPPKGANNTKYVIHVEAGIYDESVLVDKKQVNVFMYGDGIGKTIITGKKNFALMHIQTSNTATFVALGDGFRARGITFRNTAGPEGHQAVALRVQSDMSAFWDCSMEGWQDTLYYQVHRQFYRNCEISGTVDFIFGRGSAVIQNSKIILRKGLPSQYNTVTADGKELRNSVTGVVLQNVQFVAEPGLAATVKNYLGRPWKQYAKTVTMQSDIGPVIDPEGYRIWDGMNFHQTCEYLEYANRGPNAATNRRNFKAFSKSKVISAAEADQYTVTKFIQGNTWLPATGAPFTPGL